MFCKSSNHGAETAMGWAEDIHKIFYGLWVGICLNHGKNGSTHFTEIK
jgi:hypothetical protein